MSAEIVSKEPEEPALVHHDSEEFESAEEVEESGEEGEVEEVEVEVEEEVEEEEEDEPLKEKEVDEDRKNPQFIPKKGYFYEHDDRSYADEEFEQAEEEEPPTGPAVEKPKPKPVKGVNDRWSHDLYNEDEQAPKTRAELSGRYGYDIRNEDQAPRARRRRRYGRGPNKYTRKWEEEEAYQKPRGGYRGRGGRGGVSSQQNQRAEFEEEFPALGPSSSQSRKKSTEDEPIKTGTTISSQARQTNIDTDKNRGDRGRGARGGGRGGSSNRGWGRRNEFANRNRYPDRRDSEPDKEFPPLPGPAKASRPEKQDDKIPQKDIKKLEEARVNTDAHVLTSRPEPVVSTSFGRGFPNSNINPLMKSSTSGSRNPPPFTNTEYRGSESLTTAKNQSNNNGKISTVKPAKTDFDHQEQLMSHGINLLPDNFQREREARDDRDMRRSSNKGYTGDRRTQIPPRLQQQQHQQQPIETTQITSKPKRFSSQRQRQNLDPMLAPNINPGSMQNPANSAMGPVIVTGAGQAVPSAVPVSAISNYPPSQGYYDGVPSTYEAQVYETGSVTVSGGNHGPSVSPSMWVPHSSPYVTAPYPSPPQGPAQTSYPDPSAFMQAAQQGGPPIFAPPHPQFIQDPTLINYVPPVPPPTYGPPSFHSSGFQGYAQVVQPPPPPAGTYGGVTYYSTQNQLPRPHIPTMSKRPKTVLQLVEPPEKKDYVKQYSGAGHKQSSMDAGVESTPEEPVNRRTESSSVSVNTPAPRSDTSVSSKPESDLADKLDTMKLQDQERNEKVKKSPSPAPLDLAPEKSWSEQMADITPVHSPTEPTPTPILDSSLVGKSEAEAEDKSEEKVDDAAKKTVETSDQAEELEKAQPEPDVKE